MRSTTLLTLCLVLLSTSHTFAQRRPLRRTAAVFPPLTDEQAAEKQRLLDAVQPAATRDGRPPNIVLLFADDLGYADVGCYGSTEIPTPHIDRLAESGMRFTDAYVTAGTCSPSRAGLLSGRYQQRFGFEFNTGPDRITTREGRGLDPAALNIADVLSRVGYATGVVGKWHLGTRDQFHPHERGFDEFYGFLAGAHVFIDPARLTDAERAVSGRGTVGRIMRGTEIIQEDEYLTDAIAREAEAFITRHKDDPFFLYVPFNAVHTPLQATPEYQKRFAHVEDLKRRIYYAMTAAMDDAVGRVVAALEANGLRGNTLVIFSNDNGGPLYTGVQSNEPLRLGKMFLFEGGIRVPLVMQLPGVIPPGSEHHEMVSMLDLFPTICSLAGARLPSELALDGVDLGPALAARGSGPHHEALFWRNGPNRAVRMGNWKMIQSGDHIWLFDLANDIGEQHNLAADHPDQLRKLQQALTDWESQIPKPAWPARSNSRSQEVDGVPYRLAI